jgi:uncharacterized membrane protein
MKRIGRYLLRHIVIGFFAMLPVLLLYLLLGQLFDMAIALTTPITDVLPDSAFSDAVQQHFIAAVLLVMILGLVGLAARTELGTTIGERRERRYLKRLPLYEMLRNLAGSLSGNEAVTGYRPVGQYTRRRLTRVMRQSVFIVACHGTSILSISTSSGKAS